MASPSGPHVAHTDPPTLHDDFHPVLTQCNDHPHLDQPAEDDPCPEAQQQGGVPSPSLDDGQPDQGPEEDDQDQLQHGGSQLKTRQSSAKLEAVLRSVEAPIINLFVPILTPLNTGTDMLAATTPYKTDPPSPPGPHTHKNTDPVRLANESTGSRYPCWTNQQQELLPLPLPTRPVAASQVSLSQSPLGQITTPLQSHPHTNNTTQPAPPPITPQRKRKLEAHDTSQEKPPKTPKTKISTPSCLLAHRPPPPCTATHPTKIKNPRQAEKKKYWNEFTRIDGKLVLLKTTDLGLQKTSRKSRKIHPPPPADPQKMHNH